MSVLSQKIYLRAAQLYYANTNQHRFLAHFASSQGRFQIFKFISDTISFDFLFSIFIFVNATDSDGVFVIKN